MQLRETAQRGQASDYGGDRIEDAAVQGAYQARRGVEALLKKKKPSKIRKPVEKPRVAVEMPGPPAEQSPEAPAERPSLHAPALRERPRIKTREAVSGKEDGPSPGPSERGRTGPSSTERISRTHSEIGESTVHDSRPDAPSARQAGTAESPKTEPPKIKTRDVAGGHRTVEHSQKPSHQPAVKTKDTYLQTQAVATPEPPSSMSAQGQQKFIKEQVQTAAKKQAEIRHTPGCTDCQSRSSVETVLHAPTRREYVGGQAVRSPASPQEPDVQPVRKGGRTHLHAARPEKKPPKHTARRTIKTAERSSKWAVKTSRRSVTAVQQTVKASRKTVQTAVKTSQRAVQTAHAAAKASAATIKASVKAAATALKATAAAIQELTAAIAAGGWAVIAVVLVVCMAGLLIASPFGIFFMDGSNISGTESPSAIIAQLNQELDDKLSELQASGSYERVEIQGQPPEWRDVLAVYMVRSSVGENRPDLLQEVFWDMTKITSESRTIEHPASGDSAAWTETVLFITIKPRTVDDMRVFHQFSEQQNCFLDELLTEENQALWDKLLAGGSGEIVSVALSQVGNVGGKPYWSWYGFDSHVNWCACFVSWCANECGYIETGIIPRFASCTAGSNWFKARDLWKPRGSTPNPGELIFFDWDADGLPDHVGIVERVENGTVYTVEGNSSDRCRQRSYSLGYSGIFGYGTPNY